MRASELNRRDFNRLTAAALGGVVAGAGALGCGKDPQPGDERAASEEQPEEKEGEGEDKKKDVHVCRGLNTCKGQGAGGKNDCAGTGVCATAVVHECGMQNACEFQGGCGEKPGENKCKGLGSCHVPLMDTAWTTARERFEARMKKEKKQFGDAPPKKSDEE